jgi:hypothetical protein
MLRTATRVVPTAEGSRLAALPVVIAGAVIPALLAVAAARSRRTWLQVACVLVGAAAGMIYFFAA